MAKGKRVQTHLLIKILVILVNCCFRVFSSNESLDLQRSENALIETCSNYFGCGSGGFYTGFKLCCLRCNCNGTCRETHSCCPKSEYASTAMTPYRSDNPKLVCKSTVIIGQKRSIYEYPEFEFIETCTDFSDESIRLLCEDIALTNRSGVVVDNTPVLDTNTGLSYSNIYCARCNNIDVDSLAVWRPKLECKTKFDLRAESFGHVNRLERLIEYNNCLVSFEPPTSFNNVKQCYADVITACNVTGLWLAYNEMDAIQCQTLDLIYVSIMNWKRYKNIFCARCNGDTVYALSDDMCPLTSNRFTRTLTTILGFTVDELGPSRHSGLNHVTQEDCPLTFKIDPFTDECRSIYCSLPFNVDAITSTCRLFHQFIENGYFVHPFKLEFQQSTPIRDAQTITELIYVHVKEDDALDNCDIGVYYQTEISETQYLNSSFSLDFNVTSIYIIIYSYLKTANPKELFELFDDKIRTYMDFEDMVILGPESFDPVMLRYNDSEVLDWIRLSYVENFTSFIGESPSHYVFKNLYDDTVIISHKYNTNFGYCQPSVYQEDFLTCESFLYEISSEFQRIPRGLRIDFKGDPLVFNFSEFKTMNQTTIRICSDSVINKTFSVNEAVYLHAFNTVGLVFITIHACIARL